MAPSILAADKSILGEEIKRAEDAKALYLHIDVMDGIFVPNVSLDPASVKSITSLSHLVNDVHIMVESPWEIGPVYVAMGADIVTFHLEACPDESYVDKTIEAIRSAGAKVGISIKPATPIEAIYPYLKRIDLVLIMSVEPGFGGQAFISDSLPKIAALKEKIEELPLFDKRPLIEVDGGINLETGRACAKEGADILVAGSFLYGHDDFAERVKALLKA